MAVERNPPICSQCGNPVQEEDRFCGACGAKVAPVTPEDPQVIPKPTATTQVDAVGGGNRVRLLIVGSVAVLLFLLIGGGALAFVNVGFGDNLFGGSDPPGAPPDPAFDPLLPLLESQTTAPIMLPAELPSELENVGIDENLEGDRYGIAFLSTPPEDLVGGWPMANIRGSLEAVPVSEYEPDRRFEATSTEDVELPDGTEAELRHMQPVLDTAMYGSYWEGTFDKGGYTYTLSILVGQDGYVVSKQALSTMVEVE